MEQDLNCRKGDNWGKSRVLILRAICSPPTAFRVEKIAVHPAAASTRFVDFGSAKIRSRCADTGVVPLAVV